MADSFFEAQYERDRSDAPDAGIHYEKPMVPWVEVDKETAYGTAVRLCRSVRVF